MADPSEMTLLCEIVPAGHRVSLGQLARACDMSADWITELVEHGVIEPAEQRSGRHGMLVWHFESRHLIRARRAARLHRDLAINTAGLALALELMDEIADLRARLDASGERVGHSQS